MVYVEFNILTRESQVCGNLVEIKINMLKIYNLKVWLDELVSNKGISQLLKWLNKYYC